MKTIFAIFSFLVLSCNIQNKQIKLPDVGYLFPEQINPKDSSFPFYPIRSLEPVLDSTFDAFYMKKLLEAFNEENISLRPQKKPLFRIIIFKSTQPTYFIRISEYEIQIKEGLRVDYLHEKTDNLSTIEQDHFGLLNAGVPLSKRIKESSPTMKRKLDSLIRLYPELLKDEYYQYLMSKAFVPLDKPFTYSTKTLRFNNTNFMDIVNSLYAAGYWHLPMNLNCNNAPTDGNQFILECNSGTKYNVVKFWSCGDDPTAFEKTFDKIIRYAQLPKGNGR